MKGGSQHGNTVPGEAEQLQTVCSKGKHSSRTVLCARALLLLDRGVHTAEHWKLEDVSKALGISERTLNHLKERFVTDGLERALNRKPQDRPSRPVKFDGEFEAKLTQLACTDPPAGHARWTVRLLADRLVEMKITDAISPMTVQRILKKKNLSLT